MNEHATTPDPAADGTVIADVERALRVHAERSEHQLRELETDLGGMHRDSGTIQEDRDGMRRLIESVRSDLGRTQHALDRIEAGTYGKCTSCGEMIAAARLSAIPESERCNSCA